MTHPHTRPRDRRSLHTSARVAVRSTPSACPTINKVLSSTHAAAVANDDGDVSQSSSAEGESSVNAFTRASKELKGTLRDSLAWLKWPLKRSSNNVLIKPNMLPGKDGDNINGPSVIRVPEWVDNKLGEYYMYFANHKGSYIRLAYADAPEGPWTIYKPGALSLKDTAAVNHVASPDVHIHEDTQTIRMYFHGRNGNGKEQQSYVAESTDGLHFKAHDTQLGLPYFRVWRFKKKYYAIAKQGSEAGYLLRSKDGLTPFEQGPALIPRMRHGAVYKKRNALIVFYSRVGDKPERIMRSSVHLNGWWKKWSATKPVDVIRSEEDYEGANLPVKRSKGGEIDGPVHQLRDPYLFVDESESESEDDSESQYLYYSVAGEMGIAVAKYEEAELEA